MTQRYGPASGSATVSRKATRRCRPHPPASARLRRHQVTPTEGFAVGTDDPVPLDMTMFDDEPNPLGGRPKGTDSASRDAKKAASKALLDSASKEWYTQRAFLDKRAADATAKGDTAAAATAASDKRGALMAILLEKHTKHTAEGMDMARPGKNEIDAVSHRVARKLKAPARASPSRTAAAPRRRSSSTRSSS